MLVLICCLLQLFCSAACFFGGIGYQIAHKVYHVSGKCDPGYIIWVLVTIFPVVCADAIDVFYAFRMRRRRGRVRRWLAAVGQNVPQRIQPQERDRQRPEAALLTVRGFWFFNVVLLAPIFTTAYRSNAKDARCRKVGWVMPLQLALCLVLWAQVICCFFLVPAVRLLPRRLKVLRLDEVRMGTLPAEPGQSYVQRVCYVSDPQRYKPEQLPHPSIIMERESATCGICYEDFEDPLSPVQRAMRLRWSKKEKLDAQTLCKTRCGHVFHETCLLQWFKASKGSLCPFCNQDTSAIPPQGAPRTETPTAEVPAAVPATVGVPNDERV